MVEWLLYAHLGAFIVVAKELKPVVVLLIFPLLGLYGSWAREVLGMRTSTRTLGMTNYSFPDSICVELDIDGITFSPSTIHLRSSFDSRYREPL